jgi:DNA-nicking Smr family endonuclease
METLEAESVVENFIDAAVMGKLENVTIIHGKGTGALRKAVQELLRRNPQVKILPPGRLRRGRGRSYPVRPGRRGPLLHSARGSGPGSRHRRAV